MQCTLPSIFRVRADLVAFLFGAVFLCLYIPATLAKELDSDRPRIGLALSGGGARGAAHVGLLKVLERERIPVDYIAGTSMGSIVGGMYASGMSAEEIESQLLAVDWDDVFKDNIDRKNRSFRRKTDDRLWLFDSKIGYKKGDIALPAGLIQGQKINQLLISLSLPVADVEQFDDLPIPFRAVAADIQTGEAVVLDSGSLPKAIRASMSIPAIMAPVPWGDRNLVDGGIASNLPINVVREMGADIVIAVDIGTPLSERDVSKSVLSISGQLTGFLTRRNVDAEIATLTVRDILLTPDLGDITSADFDRISEAIPTGVKSAEDNLAWLRELALDEAEYGRHLAARPAVREAHRPVIEFVQFENQSTISDDYLLGIIQASHHAGTLVGQPLDVEQLRVGIDELYGLELFSHISYMVVQEKGRHGLHVVVRPKSYGPDYLQLGIKWQTSFNGEGLFNFSTSLLKTEVNSWNAEWRNALVIGEEPGVLTEFFQPLGNSGRWFASARASLDRFNVNRFAPGSTDILEQFRITQAAATVYGGREFGTWGRGSIILTRGLGTREIRVGDPTTPDVDFDIGELSAEVQVDRLDDLYYPTEGHFLSARYRMNRTELGSSDDYEQALLEARLALTKGKNTFLFRADYRTTTNGVAPPERRFRAGGLFNLSGFEFNQVSGQHFGLVSAQYRREFLSTKLANISLGTSLEYGNVWENEGDIDPGNSLLAGSVFLGAKTGVGPIFLGYGLAEGGAASFYLYVGALRNDPALR
jgi:NTE family protein